MHIIRGTWRCGYGGYLLFVLFIYEVMSYLFEARSKSRVCKDPKLLRYIYNLRIRILLWLFLWFPPLAWTQPLNVAYERLLKDIVSFEAT